MTVEELRTELETLVSGLSSSGFETIDDGIIEKLSNYSVTAAELNMKEGKHLIDNLLGAMKAIKQGKSKAESGNVRLTALDFYIKKLLGSGNTEEL